MQVHSLGWCNHRGFGSLRDRISSPSTGGDVYRARTVMRCRDEDEVKDLDIAIR